MNLRLILILIIVMLNACSNSSESVVDKKQSERALRCEKTYQKVQIILQAKIDSQADKQIKKQFVLSYQRLKKLKRRFIKRCIAKDEQSLQTFERILGNREKLLQ